VIEAIGKVDESEAKMGGVLKIGGEKVWMF
jgi:hypothetical protein